ncbi:hypothetical protein FQZ97_865220 [compost metagenome]
MHAGRRAHVGHQHVAQVEGLQVVAVEVVGLPGSAAHDFVGAGDLIGGPVEEGADGVVVLAVGGLAGQMWAVDRGIDDQPRPFVGGVAQDQGEKTGVQAQAQCFQQAGPGGWLHRAAVGQGQQFAELAGADAGQSMGVFEVVHPRLACWGCRAGWGEYRPNGLWINRPFGLVGGLG